ncbi:hypothetical protein Tco_0881319 [Tanacetum coccineum]
MTTPVIDLTVSQPASTTVQASLPTSTAITTITTTTTLPPPPPQPQQGVSNSIIIQQIGELERSIADQVDANQALEERATLCARFKDLPTSDMKEIMLQRMLEENYDKGHEDHRMAYEALQKSILHEESEQFDADTAEEHKNMKTSDSAQDPLSPPPSPTTNPDDQSLGLATLGLSKTAATTTYTALTTRTSRFKPSASSIPEDVFIHDESDFAAQDMVSNDEYIGSRHIPRVNLNQDWFKPLSEDERPATPKPSWSIPSSSLLVPIHNWASAIASSYVPPPENSPLSQTCDIRVFIDWFCKKQGITELIPEHLEGPAYEVVKAFHPDMKAAYSPDVGLEQMVLDQMWIEEECMTHMRILSVVSIDVFSIYEYDYMKQIVLRRANNQEYTIAKNDFKDLYLSDFKDLYLLNLQGHLNHLPPRDKKILSSVVNLWIRNLEATGLEFMHDYKILDSPRAVVFRDKYGMQMIMCFNKIHKFSDGTLQQIDEALDYRVKEFRVNKVNPGLNTRFWTTNDVIKSKQFMFSIQKRLKLRRIFRNLESFVGGRIQEGDYRLLQRTE